MLGLTWECPDGQLSYQAVRLFVDVRHLLPAEELKSLEFIIHDSKWDEEMQ